MKIESNSINFNARLRTASVLETTGCKLFDDIGTDGVRSVIYALHDKKFKATGAKGYRYYAQIIGEKIVAKYPQIKEATKFIKKITDENPYISGADLKPQIQPYIDKIGEEIDIEI